MVGLTGTEEQVKAASKAYRTYYKRHNDDPEYYIVDHSTQTYLMLPNMGLLSFSIETQVPSKLQSRGMFH